MRYDKVCERFHGCRNKIFCCRPYRSCGCPEERPSNGFLDCQTVSKRSVRNNGHLGGTVDAPGNRDFIVIVISGFQTFVFQNFLDGFANGNRVPVGGQGIVLQIGELDGIVRCQRMVISHNNDQFLEGDRNKDKIRLVFYHGTEADIIVTGGDSLCHRNGLFMKILKLTCGCFSWYRSSAFGRKSPVGWEYSLHQWFRSPNRIFLS